MVTVYHTLECHAMDVLSFDSIHSRALASLADQDDITRRSLLQITGSPSDWCLFSIDVRNLFGRPFEIIFERHQEGIVR